MKKYMVFFLVISLCAICLHAKSNSLADSEVIYDSSAKGEIAMKQFRVPVDQKTSGSPRIYMVNKAYNNDVLTLTWMRDNIKIIATLKTNGNKPAKNTGARFISQNQVISFSVFKADKALKISKMDTLPRTWVFKDTRKWTELKEDDYSLDTEKATNYIKPGLIMLGICIDLFHQKQVARIIALDAQLVKATKFEFSRDFGFSLK